MAQTDVAEGIEHAFVRQHAARQRHLVADIVVSIGHGGFQGIHLCLPSKPETPALAKAKTRRGPACATPWSRKTIWLDASAGEDRRCLAPRTAAGFIVEDQSERGIMSPVVAVMAPG